MQQGSSRNRAAQTSYSQEAGLGIVISSLSAVILGLESRIQTQAFLSSQLFPHRSQTANQLISFGLCMDPRVKPEDDDRKIRVTSSPHSNPMPTISSSRFGYTGQHCRRGGIGDRVGRSDAGGPCGAAQKMVCLS
jgi:hypothetical protein